MAKAARASARQLQPFDYTAALMRSNVAGIVYRPDPSEGDWSAWSGAERTAWVLDQIRGHVAAAADAKETTVRLVADNTPGQSINFAANYMVNAFAAISAAGFSVSGVSTDIDGLSTVTLSCFP